MPTAQRGKNNLMQAARAFWYNNEKGPLGLHHVKVTRKKIQTHGGPRVELDECSICQSSEWLSRITSSNRFRKHTCPTSGRAKWLCNRQDKDQWSYVHQDFSFSFGCDPDLNAPKCLYLVEDLPYQWHTEQGGNHIALNRRRGFAQAFQHDCITFSSIQDVDWQKYDLIFINNRKGVRPFYVPSTAPMIMWGHDIWYGHAQELLDAHRPMILLASCPQSWESNFDIPVETEIEPYFANASNFYTRPNLNHKHLDLLVIGERRGAVYAPRVELDNQLKQLDRKRFMIEFSQRLPRRPRRNQEPLSMHQNRYLNVYSEYIGRSRFVIFGPCGSKGAKPGRPERSAKDLMMPKYYECLGSGAIPIMPRVSQLDYLKLKPYNTHYIPLSDVWGNNRKLAKILSDYERHHHIAQSAVDWHQENADALLFDHFEDVVRKATRNRYPKRIY